MCTLMVAEGSYKSSLILVNTFMKQVKNNFACDEFMY